jgi:predicted nucleic acid-binding protein
MTNSAIIADSGPLIALSIIGQLRVLPRLYERVIIPAAVWNEVVVQGAGLPGADAVMCCDWLEQISASREALAPLSILVDRGEAEAFAIAQTIEGCTVLLDDAQARRVSERLGIPRIGTLGILRRAKKTGLIEHLKPYIQIMQENGIYIRPTLVDAVLRDVGEA